MNDQKKGFVLLFTLTFILGLTALTLQFHRYCQRRLARIRWQIDQAQAAMLVRTGVAIAQEILKADKNNYDWLAEPWHQERIFQVSGGEIKLNIEDESGKINLNGILQAEGKVNTQLKDIGERLLVVLGLSHNLLDCLLDWIDEDEFPRVFGAESTYYRNLTPSYMAANQALFSAREISLIKGFEKSVLEGNEEKPGLLNLVTVVTDSKININTCHPVILRAMGFTEPEVNEILAQ
ncbi:MAG: general secretion pathway protein GspK, partial [Candidatus Omnitrophica bacterium]|nr:general secretion pathway protein GspK [Candidatus Omnitrophota bacterium]